MSDEIDIGYYLRLLKRRRKWISLITGVITLGTLLYSLMLPNVYMAKAVIMPLGMGGASKLAAFSGQLGGLASLMGLEGNFASQQLKALLKSRTLAEFVVSEHELYNVFSAKTKKSDKEGMDEKEISSKRDSAAQSLMASMKVLEDLETGTLSISIMSKDPELSANLANWYVEDLEKFIQRNAMTSAKRNRIFIEGRLAQNKRELLEAGKGLNEFYKVGTISSVDSRTDVLISEMNKNLGELQEQKEEIEARLDLKSEVKDRIEVVEDVPQQVYLQYLTLRRNLLAQINTLLTQHFEMAKIDETKEELAFQLIDLANVPKYKSKPKRMQMVMMAFVSSLFIGVFAAFFMEYIEKVKAEAEVEAKAKVEVEVKGLI